MILSALHIVIPYVYYTYMKLIAEKRSWNLFTDKNYEPTVTIIVPTYNEAHVIVNKLQNIEKLDYPKDKLEVIIVDSASTDGTANITKKYITENEVALRILVLEESHRSGKAKALNYALQHASGEIIATSDADCLWATDSLRNAVRYLSDSSVAAVCGSEVLINPGQSFARARSLLLIGGLKESLWEGGLSWIMDTIPWIFLHGCLGTVMLRRLSWDSDII